MNAEHGRKHLAQEVRCPCAVCGEARSRKVQRENERARKRRAARGVTPRSIPLGDPGLADPVIVERARLGRDRIHVVHPDDRAGVVAAVAAGTLTVQAACDALHCVPDTLDRLLASLVAV